MRKIASENGLIIKKGPWNKEEDLKLIRCVQTHGPGQWRTLPKKAGLQRCGKSCRLRWTNYLRPDIKRGSFSFEEEKTIIQLHSVLGNKWSAMANRLPGRTDNEIKNYWNTHLRKRLLQNGIDPGVDFSKLSSILNSGRFNLSNFLNLQTLINPQLLKLATILTSSSSNNANRELFLNNHTINPINPFQNHQNSVSTFATSNLTSTHLDQTHLMHANDIQHIPDNLVNMNSDPGGDDTLTRECLTNECFTIPNYGSSQSAAQMSSPTPPLISSPMFINDSSTEYQREISYFSSMFDLDSIQFDDSI